MTFWVIIDGITRFLTFFIIVFCLTSLFYWKKDTKEDKNNNVLSSSNSISDTDTKTETMSGGSTRNSLLFISLFSLVVSSVIFAVDFFVFSTKLMDTKIK